MIFKLRVTLKGIKGFYRVYNVSGTASLYDFHKQLRSDLEFPQDQLIMFKAMTVDGDVIGRYGLFDLGSGTVDQVSLEDVIKLGATDFVYFYDVTNRKSVNITVEGEVTEAQGAGKIVLVDEKGPVPLEFENGYVAFEDLPPSERHLPGDGDDDDEDFDEDFDDDEEDDGDEEGKEIYDENE